MLLLCARVLVSLRDCAVADVVRVDEVTALLARSARERRRQFALLSEFKFMIDPAELCDATNVTAACSLLCYSFCVMERGLHYFVSVSFVASLRC